ncbi:hypothetical protein CBR_g18871 [Chara braunii]|uniref:Integrase catalytic domain-containing protein n=1 Tax=Chara braunii TaxID=69332 RepID=A0A388KWP6_CHABU|nr:hypothetical protein CBR_g18871 [Chara braunii]|eukprot:GBG74461.1 hypothetical protein CBR_g18871 [Chara braunii]
MQPAGESRPKEQQGSGRPMVAVSSICLQDGKGLRKQEQLTVRWNVQEQAIEASVGYPPASSSCGKKLFWPLNEHTITACDMAQEPCNEPVVAAVGDGENLGGGGKGCNGETPFPLAPSLPLPPPREPPKVTNADLLLGTRSVWPPYGIDTLRRFDVPDRSLTTTDIPGACPAKLLKLPLKGMGYDKLDSKEFLAVEPWVKKFPPMWMRTKRHVDPVDPVYQLPSGASDIPCGNYKCHVSSATSDSATSDTVPRPTQCHVSSATPDTVPCQQCHVRHSATSAVPRQTQCHISNMTGLPGQLANEPIADYKKRFQAQLVAIEAKEQRQLAVKAAQLQAEEAATAEKLRLQAEADADAQARRKEAQDLLQRHESTSIEKLKFWHFEPNGDDGTPEEHHKEFLSKLVTRLLYACNYQRSELEKQYQDLTQQHQELAKLRHTVQSHEDATRALNARLLDLEQAVPGPAAGASSSASSSRQLQERVDHVVEMLGDISTFAAPITINSQMRTLKTKVQQLQSMNADDNPKMYKMPTFQLDKFDDYTQQDPVLWWEAFTTQLRILPVAKHAYIGALFLNSKGGWQTWLSHLATSHGVDVPDLKDKITWEELTRLWKKRFIVDDAPTLAINRLFTMSQGNTATRDWLTEWQKIAAVPNLELAFTHLRREFYNRSCPALSQALGDREQYSTFAEIIDKAREIIKTNRSIAHEKSTWQPTYVEKVRTGPRQQHFAAVQSDSGDNPTATPTLSDGDQVAAVQPRSNKKSRNNGKAKSALQAGNGQPVQVPWVKFGLTEAEYKLGKLSSAEGEATPPSTPPDSAALLAASCTSGENANVASSRYTYEDYAVHLVPPLDQSLHVQQSTACTVSSPSTTDSTALPPSIAGDSSSWSRLEVLDPLTFTDLQWMPVPPTERLPKQHCNVLMAQLRDYLHIAGPAPLMDAGVEVVDLHAYIVKIDREFKTQHEDHPVNFFHRTVHIRDRNGVLVPCTVPLPHPSISCHVVSAASMRASIIRGDIEEMGVCFLHALPPHDASSTDSPSDPRITELLDAYSNVFEGPHGVVPDRPIRHEIILEDGAVPPRGCIYRMSEEGSSVLRAQLDDLLEKGWIRPSSSPYENQERRPSPTHRRPSRATGRRQVFLQAGPQVGYHQLEIREEDRYKTAFKTRYGHFEWLVMPFGLTNAPTTFQAAMTTEFRHMLDRFVLIYLDNILVYNWSLEEHVEHLHTVLERLRQAKYKANRDKCEFARQELKYLGHYVTPQGIRPLADKIEALRVWPEPTNTTDVQSPKVPFVFDDDARRSFQALKTAMLMAPVLSIYDPTLPTRVTTDASGYGIGAVFEQHDGDDGHPVEYFSHKVPPINSLDDARKKELLAFVMALKRWWHFLLGRRRFTWVTDNNPLTYYKTQDTVSSTIGRWMYFIDQCDFTPKHLPGLSNRVADALSRRPDLCAMTHHAFAFDEELQRHFIRAYESDPDFATLYTQLSSDHPPASHYRIADGYLLLHSRGKDLLCVPRDRRLRTRLLGEYHDSRLAGHFGVNRTIARLRQRFQWPDLITDVTRYCDSCEVCRRSKPRNRNPYGELHPMPIPCEPGLSIAMDVTGPFPRDRLRHDGILTVVDRLTFRWVTDDNPLVFYKSQDTINSTIARWMAFIDQFDFFPDHIPEKSNRFADALSRRPDLCPAVYSTFEIDDDLRESFIRGYQADPHFRDKYANCSSPNPVPSHYRIQEGYLLVHSRGKDLLCVPNDSHLHTRLLGEFHDAPASGHFGVNRTLGRLRQRFYWPDLLKDATRYCESCEVCRRYKSHNHRPFGELHPLPVPLGRREAIAMDITGPFPKHKTGVDGILTVVDRLTKYAMFLPCRYHAKAPELAEVLYTVWIRSKGYPKEIVCDRDTRFLSDFWVALVKRWGSSLKPSSARHPQTDGQTERAHQTAQVLLRTLIRPDQVDWVERLPDVELAYNSSIHPAIGMSPFEFEHGSPISSLLDATLPRTAESDDHLAFLRRMQEILVKARD